MMPHVIDSALYRDQFGTAEMRAVFADEALVRRWLDVEVALARVEARLGIIPEDAARGIAETARTGLVDLEEVKRLIDLTGHPLMPLITVFSRACPDGAGEYVHWGATTQDIMDTACVLQLREAYVILSRQMDQVVETLACLARRHRDTPMPGRTHGQQALPITLGFKLAVLVAELDRHRQRLEQLGPRLLVAQLSGAAGTLAALGGLGPAVQREFALELDLQSPPVAWHTARDSFAEWTCLLSMIGATCSKAAGEVIQLQRTEVAELEEPHTEHNIGSSTMPQKRNPMRSEAVVAIGRVLRQHAALSIECMVGQHERDMSAWQAEWEYIPETCVLLSGALEQTRSIYAGLTVRPERMAANLKMTGGLINAEAVMIALAPRVGRQSAHELVGAAARESFERGTSFLECLLARGEVTRVLGEEALSSLLRPESYLGDSAGAVDRVLESLSSRMRDDTRVASPAQT
jgi:adenylosuccinate lyase